MKKLEKLTLKEMRTFNQFSVLENPKTIIGGIDPSLGMMSVPGWSEYYDRYGTQIPEGCYYDASSDQLCRWEPIDQTSIGDTTVDLWAWDSQTQQFFEVLGAIGVAASDILITYYFKGAPIQGQDLTNGNSGSY